MRKSLYLWSGLLLLAVGLVLAGTAGWMTLADRAFHARAVEATGTVVGFEQRRLTMRRMTGDGGARRESTGFAPIVEWRDRRGTVRRFSGSVATRPPAYRVGERVRLLHLPGQPESARIDDGLEGGFPALVLGASGVVLAGAGLALAAIHRRRRRSALALLRNGIPVEAAFVECRPDRRVRVNGRHPWRIVAEAVHPLTGEMRRFESDHVWDDLTPALAGRTVRVLCDPADPRSYHVDLPDRSGSA